MRYVLFILCLMVYAAPVAGKKITTSEDLI